MPLCLRAHVRWFAPLLACVIAAAVAPSMSAQGALARAAAMGRGRLFMVGGGPQPDALVKEVIDRAGGSGKAKIISFAMASASGLTSGEEKAADLRQLGAVSINVLVNAQQANTDSVAHLLDNATGVWFGGGDQVLLAKALKGTRTGQAIHRRYEAGAVIGGTSAGAAVMSAIMITGDERHPGGVRPPRDSAESFMTAAGAWRARVSQSSMMRAAAPSPHPARRSARPAS